ncbi:Sucrose transport protein SUT4 [Hibiscus syriacus]|uniref:Sucrose transport protein SUT4 n=1 Tax=Hibiscus syriacus TaxID=106335 RepID=A0A6A2YUE4_HIBSY|nr:Sucrose transport protein SUT4 [Hibiscus syriacus]
MAGTSDSVSIKVPYRNLRKDSEVEMIEDPHLHSLIDLNSSPSSPSTSLSTPSARVANCNSNLSSPIHIRSKDCSLVTLVLSCTIAAGVQFGWALQLSLLTPYIQTLGIEHAFSSFIWLCGPITGLVVQPCVGVWSDKCTSKYGRRRPFILAGSLMISVAVIVIGFSADIGYILGDTTEHCSTFKGTRTRAAFVFVIGFWMLDLANNTVQGPARALLADLSAGASGSWHRWFPFLKSRACCEACANLKAAFLVAVVFLLFCTAVTIYFANEVPLLPPANESTRLSDSAPLLDDSRKNGFQHSKSKPDVSAVANSNRNTAENAYERVSNSRYANSKDTDVQNEVFSDGPGSVLVNLLTSLRHLPPGMHSVLIVMALSWLSWFPFFLFDTDWMGREVYHGDPKGNASEIKLYDQGVREGAFGLLLNSVVLGVSSFFIKPMCQRMGSRLVWAMGNYTVFACMALTAIISLISVKEYSQGIEHVFGGSAAIRTASLVVFTLLGFPLAITYSVPFSITAELTADSGGGQGLAIGVLNLAIVVPQMIVSLGAGPWDALFGGGNIPAFILASFCALAAGVIATLRLPDLSNSFKSSGFHFG